MAIFCDVPQHGNEDDFVPQLSAALLQILHLVSWKPFLHTSPIPATMAHIQEELRW